MGHHQNDGKCEKCLEVMHKYAGFNAYLETWFKSFQSDHPEVHISCAGRGKDDQNKARASGASRAGWLESAHNFNCAIDIFVILPGSQQIYPLAWFTNILAKRLTPFLKWYGDKKWGFYELPHIEIADWRDLRAKGLVQNVETPHI